MAWKLAECRRTMTKLQGLSKRLHNESYMFVFEVQTKAGHHCTPMRFAIVWVNDIDGARCVLSFILIMALGH